MIKRAVKCCLNRIAICILSLTCTTALADKVHVYQRTSAGGVVEQLSDETLDTGAVYSTVAAPTISGYIFTHWTIDKNQTFEDRDVWGRALDSAAYLLLEELTLTANYLPSPQDQDKDGIADGYEIYWYGDLSKDASSDTDADGFAFAREIANGFNPLFPDDPNCCEVLNFDSPVALYNPHGYAPYVIRSEPEGALFATITEYASPGDVITTSSYSPVNTTFAYWTVNDIRCRDAWGVSLNSVTFTATDQYITECVAHCVTNQRERMSYYWYGDGEHGADSDSDADGFTFAQEIANGTIPVMPDESSTGEILNFDSGIVQYNPFGYVAYVIRSEPEGVLFATESDYKAPGTLVTTPSLSPDKTSFAYWTKNGERQQDPWGVASNSVSFLAQKEDLELIAYAVADADKRQSLYWYGDETHAMTSDTDGDGYTFAQEIANGTNPIFPDEVANGEILNFDSAILEVNAQSYEQVRGAIVGNAYTEVFYSRVAGNQASCLSFGANLVPFALDLNADGLFDIVLMSSAGTRIYRNVGGIGNPEFVEDNAVSLEGFDFGSTNFSRLAGWNLNTQPTLAVTWSVGDVDADGYKDLLLSDEVGHIWYYRNTNAKTNLSEVAFVLQHKVWGGTYDGFANRLAIATVDWEDDGDLDCLCGTAEGKLMLLRNPKVGRPTNVRALVSVDNVLLNWDPNAQSRIRGYKVYRSEAGADAYKNITTPYTPLPTYRDYPPAVQGYDYKVSSISRFYTPGNSTPTESESMKTDAVRATLGDVRFFWNDVVCKVGEAASVMLSIENSLNYDVAGRVQVVSYDAAYLEPVEIIPSGLTEGIKYSHSFADGQWTITLTAGVLPAGSGKFFTLVFRTLKSGETTVGEAKVTITSSPKYQLGDVDGDGDVDVEDLRLLAKLKNGTGRKYNSDQLRAGDFNGNGKLDNADYQALRELVEKVKEKM